MSVHMLSFYLLALILIPPPPPSKPPQIILDEILDLMKRMRNPDLTLSKY